MDPEILWIICPHINAVIIRRPAMNQNAKTYLMNAVYVEAIHWAQIPAFKIAQEHAGAMPPLTATVFAAVEQK